MNDLCECEKCLSQHLKGEMTIDKYSARLEKEVVELRAENERLKAERDWLPIKSAPKDGMVGW